MFLISPLWKYTMLQVLCRWPIRENCEVEFHANFSFDHNRNIDDEMVRSTLLHIGVMVGPSGWNQTFDKSYDTQWRFLFGCFRIPRFSMFCADGQQKRTMTLHLTQVSAWITVETSMTKWNMLTCMHVHEISIFAFFDVKWDLWRSSVNSRHENDAELT